MNAALAMDSVGVDARVHADRLDGRISGEAINFLVRCESDGITLENCPAYVREWMTRQRG